jgi:gamma-glutamylcyclotransferase
LKGRLSESEKPELDKAEGLGHGYNETIADVRTANDVVTASMYVADHDAIDNTLVPYTWYKDIVVTGARQHRLPESYIAVIEAVDAQIDPDIKREAAARKILPC